MKVFVLVFRDKNEGWPHHTNIVNIYSALNFGLKFQKFMNCNYANNKTEKTLSWLVLFCSHNKSGLVENKNF